MSGGQEFFNEGAYKTGDQVVNLEQVENNIQGAISTQIEQNPTSRFLGNSYSSDYTAADVALGAIGGHAVTAGVVGTSMFLDERGPNAQNKTNDAANNKMIFSGNKKTASRGLFIGKDGQTITMNSKFTNGLMPMTSYFEKRAFFKEQQKKISNIQNGKVDKNQTLYTNVQVAGMSLNDKNSGAGTTGKPFVTKGMKVTPQMAIDLGLADPTLVQQLNSVRKVKMEEPSLANLLDGLRRGDDKAEAFVAHNPNNTMVQDIIRYNKAPGMG